MKNEGTKKVYCFFLVVYGLAVSGVFGWFSASVVAEFVISSMGFGGGVVAIVQPIHAPMKRIATKAMKTGTAISQN